MKRLALAATALALLFATDAAAQSYPNRPIRIIVGYGAGGSTDLATRVVAAHMEKTLKQPITVENRTGGNGAVGTGEPGEHQHEDRKGAAEPARVIIVRRGHPVFLIFRRFLKTIPFVVPPRPGFDAPTMHIWLR